MLVPTNAATLPLIAYARRYLLHTGDFDNLETLRESAASVAGYPPPTPGGRLGAMTDQQLKAAVDNLSRGLELDLLLRRHGLLRRRAADDITPLQRAARAFDRDTDTTVYFARSSADAGVIKIGHSANPHSRMLDLHYVAGDRVWPILTLAGGRLRETHLHRRFRALRVGQEWFQLDGCIVDFLRDKDANGVW